MLDFQSTSDNETVKNNMKICFDAGHGMGNRTPNVFDPGAESSGVKESDIALDWALTGKFIFEREGLDWFLTRRDNKTNTPVGKRDDLATANNCTHFLSIHCNASNGQASGIEVFYRDQDDKIFAQVVIDCLFRATGLKSRGLKLESDSQHSRLAVLDFKGRTCLMEIGFIDNINDRTRITMKETRIKFFELLAEALSQ